MEPWHFNKHVLALKQLKEDIQPSAMTFNQMPFWMRLYHLPYAGKNEETLKQIGSQFGEVIELDKNTIIGATKSIRLKIMLNLQKPLKRGTRVRIGKAEPCWIPATYERLSSFCYWCGRLGHNHKDCEILLDRENINNEEIEVGDLPYRDWMRASPMKVPQGTKPREGSHRDTLRKSLFKQKSIPFGENSKEVEAEIHTTEHEVSELLNSLQKVEVSAKKRKGSA